MSTFPRITTAVALFNASLRKVILVKRPSGEAFPETFALPGGRVEKGESLLEAAIREVQEETGLSEVPSLQLGGAYRASGVVMVALTGIMLQQADISLGIWVPVDNLNEYQLAPNVSRAIFDARRVLESRQASLLIETLPSSIERAVDCVANSVIKVGDDVGWDHYLGNHRIGIVGTSLGVLALSQSSSEHYRDLLHLAADTLIRNQHPLGGWTTRSLSVDKGHPVTVSTGYAMWALTSLEKDATHQEVIARAAEWLAKTQKSDGGWAAWVSGENSQVTSTTLALTALTKADLLPDARRRAIDWVLSAQLPSGGWGITSTQCDPSVQATPPHTGRALCALVEAGLPLQSHAISEGVNWLLCNCSPGGTWTDASEVTMIGEGRLDFKHAGLQWALTGLLISGITLNSSQVLLGLGKLLGMQQPNGGWPHSMTPGHQPTWAIFDAVQALKLVLSTLPGAMTRCITDPVDTRPVAQLLDNLVFLGKSLEMQEEREKKEELEQLRLKEERGTGAAHQPISHGSLILLQKILSERLSEDDLRLFCFELGVDYAGLPGETKPVKAMELVADLKRKESLARLFEIGRSRRPDIHWDLLR